MSTADWSALADWRALADNVERADFCLRQARSAIAAVRPFVAETIEVITRAEEQLAQLDNFVGDRAGVVAIRQELLNIRGRLLEIKLVSCRELHLPVDSL